MSEDPPEYLLVAATNVAYIFLACCLWAKGYLFGAAFVFSVALASTAYHIIPSSNGLELLDKILAYATILWAAIVLTPKVIETNMHWPLYVGLALLLIGASYVFYKTTGDDHKTPNYIIKHSLWHFGTAAAGLILLLGAPQNESRKEIKKITRELWH